MSGRRSLLVPSWPPVWRQVLEWQEYLEWYQAKGEPLPRELTPAVLRCCLVPSSSLGPPLAERLTAQGVPAQFMRGRDLELESQGVKVMTLHAAKGLEFPIVAVAHVEADRLPKETTATDPEDLQEHLDNQRRIFYVSCTRAMRYLFVTYDRSLPSPFLELLSHAHWRRAE